MKKEKLRSQTKRIWIPIFLLVCCLSLDSLCKLSILKDFFFLCKMGITELLAPHCHPLNLFSESKYNIFWPARQGLAAWSECIYFFLPFLYVRCRIHRGACLFLFCITIWTDFLSYKPKITFVNWIDSYCSENHFSHLFLPSRFRKSKYAFNLL